MRISPYAVAYRKHRSADLMTDACKVWTPSEEMIQVPGAKQGTYKRSAGTLKYEGPCKYWQIASSTPVAVNDEIVTQVNSYLSVPWDAPIPESMDWIKITKMDEEPTLVGRTIEILSVARGGKLRSSRVFLVKFTEAARKDTW